MSKPLVCQKCQKGHAQQDDSGHIKTKIAKSSLKGAEYLWVILLPVQPYRCLQCYHRFWRRDAFFAHTKRAMLWLFLLFMIAILIWPQLRLEQSNQYQNIALTRQATTDNPVIADVIAPNLTEAAPSTSTSRQSPSKLAQAKKKEQDITSLNQQKQANLNAQLGSQHVERQSLLKIEIKHMIDAWRKSWEQGDGLVYLKFYSENFQPSNQLTYEQWRVQRIKKVRPSNEIKISLSEFTVMFIKDRQAVVSFDQQYTSRYYSDKVRKKLSLLKQGDDWKIASETVEH